MKSDHAAVIANVEIPMTRKTAKKAKQQRHNKLNWDEHTRKKPSTQPTTTAEAFNKEPENVMTGGASTTQTEQLHDHEQRPRRITTTTHTETQHNIK